MLAWRAIAVQTAALCLSAQSLAAQTDGSAFFEKNIRPLLAANCLSCHSEASRPVMGALRLDSREHAMQGGSRGPSIVPGKPDESLLIKAVLHTADSLRMPPGNKLKDSDAAMLAEWIKMGAPWGSDTAPAAKPEKFWAFIKPEDPAVPEVRRKNWVRSPVDAFVLAALEEKGLAPAPPADKRTLIRRATYDLTGLPPTTAEIADFLNDQSPDAFARLVERLLASERYGERWGRHWLDVARYADSNGLDENLVYRNAFRYRDYVIAAFNKDKPYDQFLQEQIAGDLLSPTSDEKLLYERWTATGFLSLGAKMLAEDDPVKMKMDIVDEQLDTTMRAFLGLTVGCARCHDHKFDPIPQKDYYALAGIFSSSKTMENYKVVAKWHEFVLAPEEDRNRLAAHEAAIEARRKEVADTTRAENDKLKAAATDRIGSYLMAAAHLQRDKAVQIAPVESSPDAIIRTATSFNAGNVNPVLEKKQANVPKDRKGPFYAEYVIEVPQDGNYQLDMLDLERGGGTHDLWVNQTWVSRGAAPVQNRAASPETGGWSYAAIVRLQKGANTIRLEHASRFPYFSSILVAPHTGSVTPLTSVQTASKFGVNASFLEQLVEHLHRSNGASASVFYAWETLGTDAPRSAWTSPVAQLFDDKVHRTPDELASRYESLFRQALKEGETSSHPGLKAMYEFLKEKFGPFRAPTDARRYYSPAVAGKLAAIEEDVRKLEAATPESARAMGVRDSDTIGDLPLHIRGSHWTLGEKVPRGFLSVIAGESQPALSTAGSGRLQLARWMTASDHPLTSRVMVNRIWRGHFGRGIVRSVDNFGRLGDKPSNQPLLDWLAVRFMEKGWSVKAMHRLMMLSNTYQMSSAYDAKAAELDPENTLLWRMPRRRLEAESIRDAIVSVSGALQNAGGGSILRYKDRQYVANTAKGGDIDYDRPVRAVYLPVIRSSMYDVFQAFDLPDPSSSNGDRDSTVVAPQALFMMNSSIMLRHSRAMAENLPSADDKTRIREAYERALGRLPTSAETDDALSFVHRMKNEWKGDSAKAWQSFCKSLMASSEFIYID